LRLGNLLPVDYYIDRNSAGLARLNDLIARLSERDLRRPVQAGGWSIAVVLAHIAFWDAWTIARWDRFEERGSFDDIPDSVQEIVNYAGLAQWQALPPAFSLEHVGQVAIAVVARIRRLPPHAVKSALDTDRFAMLDRTYHWNPHLDEVEAVVGQA